MWFLSHTGLSPSRVVDYLDCCLYAKYLANSMRYLVRFSIKDSLAYSLIILCIFIQVTLSICVKIAFQQPWFTNLWEQYLTYTAYVLMSGGYVFLWQYVLKYTALSRANSIMSLTVLFIFASGVVFFEEPINTNSILGIFLLATGLFLIMRPSPIPSSQKWR